MLKRASALYTLIRHRHLTPSCGGHVPTAERTLDPARMFLENLTPSPELENSLGHSRQLPSPRGMSAFPLLATEADMGRCGWSDSIQERRQRRWDNLKNRPWNSMGRLAKVGHAKALKIITD